MFRANNKTVQSTFSMSRVTYNGLLTVFYCLHYSV